MMIPYYKKSFLFLFYKIKEIEREPYNNPTTIYEVQDTLIKKIKYIEKQIKSLKQIEKSSDDEDEKTIYWEKVEAYRRVLYLFKHIGDSLAYLFIERQDFKPLSLNNAPGFITGKSGFKEEKKLLTKVSTIGFPCVLADLTNELRHGDVYVFRKDSNPLIIEVKASKTKNPRSKRQQKKLNKLQHYLTNNEIEGFHGKGIKVVRVEYGKEPVYHLNKLNKMISYAKKKGSAAQEIENGLYYFVTTEELESHLDMIIKRCKNPMVHFLNTDKLERKIYPYYPIILSIGDPISLLDYFLGDLCIFVIIDLSVVVEKLESKGYDTKLLPDDDEYILSINSDEYKSIGMDEAMRVSYGFFGKVIFEFVSLDWMIGCIAERPEKVFKVPMASNLYP